MNEDPDHENPGDQPGEEQDVERPRRRCDAVVVPPTGESGRERKQYARHDRDQQEPPAAYDDAK